MERFAGLMIAALFTQLGMSLPWTSDEVPAPIVISGQMCNDTNGRTTCETPIAKTGKKHDPYDREGNYGLVPAFLIGAASVIVIYITIHCLYVQCYAKKRMNRLLNEQQHNQQQAQTIMIKDGTATLHPVTPMVKYEGGYGKTELVHAAPYIMYNAQNENSANIPQSATVRKQRSKVKSSNNLLRSISQKIKSGGQRSKNARGAGSTGNEQSAEVSTLSDSQLNEDEFTPPQASICFVPVNRPTSGSGSNNTTATEWTPLKGYMYSTVLLSHRSNPDQSTNPQQNINDNADTDTSAPPIVIIPPEEWERHVHEDYMHMNEANRTTDSNIPDVCEQVPFNTGHKSISDVLDKVVIDPVEESSPDTEREHAASLIQHLVQVHDT